MIKMIKTTREDLIIAFNKWNIDYINNPDNYEEIDDSLESAETQADKLIELLKK